MKLVLITGAKGFIGRNLALYISRQNIKVIGIGHGTWMKNDYEQYGITHWVDGEVSQGNVDQLVSITGFPDTIFHLAGGSSVRLSINFPDEDFQRTVNTSIKLLEWVRRSNPSTRVVLASSAAIYGDKYNSPIKESDISFPLSPYGYHKRISEMLFESYAENYGLSIKIVRLFSVYGSGLKKQLLWDLCNKLNKSPDKVVLSGSGAEQRDWLHVEDAASALEKVCSCKDARIFNAGMGQGVTVREIAKSVINSFDSKTKLEFSGECPKGDPKSLVADISRIRNTGFTPSWNLREGIDEYVNWFKSISK